MNTMKKVDEELVTTLPLLLFTNACYYAIENFQSQVYTDEDGNKVIIEYRENDDGKKVKVR